MPDATLAHIRVRVAEYPWHEMPDDGGWAYGANLGYMQELCAYWLDEYDWRKHEARLIQFSHCLAEVGGIDLRFIREKGSGPAPLPLVISHGWPGSIVEFLEIVEPLAHPERFGDSVRRRKLINTPTLAPMHPAQLRCTRVARRLNGWPFALLAPCWTGAWSLELGCLLIYGALATLSMSLHHRCRGSASPGAQLGPWGREPWQVYSTD